MIRFHNHSTLMTSCYSYELTDFNLDGQIKIDGVLGLVKLFRSDDGRLILVTDDQYGLIQNTNPTPSNIVNPTSALGLVLDIGIRHEKALTYGGGFYFGTKLVSAQSNKKVSRADFDLTLLKQIDTSINGYFKSGDPAKEALAMKVDHLLDAYNNSRLLFPNFYNDSYLGLMRILDAIVQADGRYDFATAVALISPDLNREIFDKLAQIYPDRIKTAGQIFLDCLQTASQTGWSCHKKMAIFDDPSKVIFSCLYSAYQYRSKFVHQGFPFPDTVKEGGGADSGTAYLNPALGTALLKVHRPDGYQDGDSIDIHAVITDPAEAMTFQNKYFTLIPTWHFLKKLTRTALINQISGLI